MGAYDNPKILPPPNYAEIYQRSFLSAQAGVNQAFAGFRAKKKQKGIDINKAEDQYDKRQTVVNTLPKELQKEADLLNDKWFKNEMDLINGDIERSDYRNIKKDINGTLDNMANDGKEINKLFEDVKGSKLSRYQNKGYTDTLGLANAWENRAIKINYQDGKRVLKWNDLEGNEQTLDFTDTTLTKALGFNDVYEFDNKKLQEMGGSVSSMKTDIIQIKQSEGGIDSQFDANIYSDAKKYLPTNYNELDASSRAEAIELANAKFRSEKVQGLTGEFGNFFTNENDSGSLFLDNSYEALVNIDLNDPTKSTLKDNAAGLIERALEGIDLTNDQKNTINESLRLGVYTIEEENDPDGKIKMGMDNISRYVLAEQTFDAATKKDNITLKESTVILSPNQIKERALKLEGQELQVQKARKDAGGGDDDEVTNLLDYFSQDTGPLGFGGNVTKAKSANKFINNMQSNGFFDANGNFKNTGEIIKTIRDTKNQGVYGYDVTQGRQFANFKTADEINDIIPIMKKAAAVKGGGEPLTEQDMSALQNFGFSKTNFKNTNSRNNMNKFVRYFEELGINGTDDIFSSDNVNSYFEFKEANRGGFTTTETPGTKGMYKDSGATGTTKLLSELPLSNDADGGTKVSAIDLGNIANELYDKEGLYQYIKFN